MKLLRPTLLAATAFLPAFTAAASDWAAEPRLAWSVSFGGAATVGAPTVQLALDAPRARVMDSRLTVAQLDLGSMGGALRLAGLPLWQRDYRLAQNEPAPGSDVVTSAGSTPWYSRQWVWWTVGGLAATAALSGGVSSDTSTHNDCTGSCNGDPQGRTTVVTVTGSGTERQVYAGCVQGTCVVCPTGDVASSCFASAGSGGVEALDIDRDRWLETGTGQMGDLPAR